MAAAITEETTAAATTEATTAVVVTTMGNVAGATVEHQTMPRSHVRINHIIFTRTGRVIISRVTATVVLRVTATMQPWRTGWGDPMHSVNDDGRRN